MVDLSKISSNNGKLDLLYPGSTKKLGLQLEILAPDHPDRKQYISSQRDKHRFLAQRGRPAQTADEIRWAKEMAVLSVVGWTWSEDDDGNPGAWQGTQPEFSKALMTDMVELDFILSQIIAFGEDEKNFFRVSQRT